MKKNYIVIAILSLILINPSFLNTHDEGQIATRAAIQAKSITLFYYPSCPYCHKVINFLKKINHLNDVALVNCDQPQNLALLIKLSNGRQCPFLFDEEKNIKMLESSDIIQYLATRF